MRGQQVSVTSGLCLSVWLSCRFHHSCSDILHASLRAPKVIYQHRNQLIPNSCKCWYFDLFPIFLIETRKSLKFGEPWEGLEVNKCCWESGACTFVQHRGAKNKFVKRKKAVFTEHTTARCACNFPSTLMVSAWLRPLFRYSTLLISNLTSGNILYATIIQDYLW